MIDIHSHILPGIDDGATDLAESIRMAKMAVKDGVTAMIATPHITDTTINPAILQAKLGELQQALNQASIPLQLYSGGEVAYHYDGNMRDYTLCGGKYILLELPHKHVPEDAEQKIYALHVKGYSVIIAHPERNRDILMNPAILENLLDCGALAQITAESITGQLGSQVQHCAHHLLRCNMVHFLASDCHSSLQRKPLLKKGLAIAGKIMGTAESRNLIETNPQKILAQYAAK